MWCIRSMSMECLARNNVASDGPVHKGRLIAVIARRLEFYNKSRRSFGRFDTHMVRRIALMKVIVTLVAGLFISAIGTHSIAAPKNGEVYSYHRPDLNGRPVDIPTASRSGDLELANGTKIPLFSLSMDSARTESGPEKFEPKTSKLHFNLKNEISSKLAAYAHNEGIILVPKDWVAKSAAIGVDGSMFLLFGPEKPDGSYMLYSSTGACVGCAENGASLYFDEARSRARDDEFMFYRKSDLIRLLPLNNFEKAYSIKVKSGNPVDGIAYFDSSGDSMFFDVQISLPAIQHELATAILNQFLVGKDGIRP